MGQPVSVKKYTLVMGENDFTSPAATKPDDARKLQSLIASISGELEREHPAITTATVTGTPAHPIRAFFQFKHQSAGVFTIHYFVASDQNVWHATNVNGPWTSVLTVVAIPVFVEVDNTLHVSDGTSNWIFDGTSYVTEGLALPPNPPAITVTAGAGTPNIVVVNRYYWTTYEDVTATRDTHEGSSSSISAATGAVANSGNVGVYQEPGTLTTNGTTAVVGVSTAFSQRHVGMALYTAGQLQGVIASVTDATHLTLAAASATSASGVHFIIAPQRATHWKIYASASEEDKVGLQLAENTVTTVSYTDTSPMVGATGSIFVNVERPMLNDPPNATTIMDVYQHRIWRRDEASPNAFTYSAYEEVLAELAGYPFECVPGVDPHSISPNQINETVYPDQSAHINCIRAHGDAVYLGTEKNTIPMFGQDLTSFQLSQVNAFSVGMAGRHAAVSTPFGLIFLSYDKKVYMYPTQTAYFATMFGGEQTSSLVEIGRPKRYEWEKIDGSDFANAQMVFYNYGRRNWLVFTYRRKDTTYATWVFDFESKGWFQLQQGYTAIGVFEITSGEKALFGATAGSSTLNIIAIDDLTGNIAIPGGTNYPVGTYRQYTDFGTPGGYFLVKGIEYEKSDPTMEVDVTVWLDPADPDNPGTGIPLLMAPKRIGPKANQADSSSRFRGNLSSDTGGTCQRLLVEFVVAASAVNAKLRGVAVDAEQLEKDPSL